MKQIRRKILLSVSTHPENGTYIHLCYAIRNSNTSRRNILKLFNEFMGEEEYDSSDKSELIDYLVLQSTENNESKNTLIL